jgi:peroxiredoxin
MVVRAVEKKFTFPYLFDNGQKVYPQYGATRTPHIFIVQKVKDELIVQYVGAIDNNYKDAADATEKYVEDAVESLLKKKDVKVPVTVAVGCGIKVQK